MTLQHTSLPSKSYKQSSHRRSWPLVSAMSLLALAGMGGCEVDSFFDPSVAGRWEHTPTNVPILESIEVLEHDAGSDFVDVSQVLPEDLVPDTGTSVILPGDTLEITIYDFVEGGVPSLFQQLVAPDGSIDLLQIPPVNVAGLTVPQATQRVVDEIIDAELLDAPEVSIVPLSRREQSFGVFGAITGVGRYAIPSPDYRLLDAMTDAGGVSPSIPFVYVIRQVSVADPTVAVRPANTPSSTDAEQTGTGNGTNTEDSAGVDIEQLIRDLTADPTSLSSVSGDGSGHNMGQTALRAQYETGADASPEPAAPAIDLIDDSYAGPEAPLDLPAAPATSSPPALELAEPSAGNTIEVAEDDVLATNNDTGRWMFIDSRWVKVVRTVDSGLPVGDDPLGSTPDAEELITQRVIEVPTGPLLQGVAAYNVIIRPGDVINVPAPEQGVVYVMGPGIARPGTYNLPLQGRLTLSRLTAAAGGFGPLAIPERVDVTRMVGRDRQGTVRIDMRAVLEGTQPDVFVKPDDLVNYGTNFWASPIAVFRNGFRVSYGFGFLLDRNFGNDVFGAPPDSIN